MPHLTLEYTSNTAPPDNWQETLLALHRTLEEVGGIALANCKSRIYSVDKFIIADGQSREGFVHLDIIFVRGRSEAVKTAISKQCLDILKSAFLPINSVPLQITVDVGDITLETYSKYPEGTLGHQQQ